jgi:hypothetical protein
MAHNFRHSAPSSWCHALSVIALFCLAPGIQAEGIINADLEKDFIETHDPEVKVSGNVIVGVMVEDADRGLNANRLGFSLGKPGKQSLCLRVTSRDGAYLSINGYTLTATNPALVALPYLTTRQDVIEQYTNEPDALAIVASPGSCNDFTPGAYFLPAMLDREQEMLSGGRLSIYVNGFDATDVYYRIAGSGAGEFSDCSYIDEGRHTAFNFRCDIDPGDLPAAGPAEIEIERERYGREIEPVLAIRLLPGTGAVQESNP